MRRSISKAEAWELLSLGDEGVYKWNALRRQDAVVPDLSGVRLDGIGLEGVNLSRMKLSDATFIDTSLRGADLTNAMLDGATFTFLRGANLGGASMKNCDLQDCEAQNSNFSYADLSDADLRGAELNGARFFGTNLSNADLSRASLQFAAISQVNVSNAKIADTQIGDTIVDVDFGALDLAGMRVESRCRLTVESLTSACNAGHHEFVRRCGYMAASVTKDARTMIGGASVPGVQVCPARSTVPGTRTGLIDSIGKVLTGSYPVWIPEDHGYGNMVRFSLQGLLRNVCAQDRYIFLVDNHSCGDWTPEECRRLVEVEKSTGKRLAVVIALDDTCKKLASSLEWRDFFDRKIWWCREEQVMSFEEQVREICPYLGLVV